MTLHDSQNRRRGADYATFDNRLDTVKLTPPERSNLWSLALKLIDDPANNIDYQLLRDSVAKALGPDRADDYLARLRGTEVPNFRDVSRRENVLLLAAAYPHIPGADEDAKMDWVIREVRPAFTPERWGNEIMPYLLERIAEYRAAGGTLDRYPDVVADTLNWRRDLETFPVENGVFRFHTRNVERPLELNENGGAEYIIARLDGRGFQRVLIMAMQGNRPPSRIFIQFGSDDFHETQHPFPMPLMEEMEWEVSANNGPLLIKLNGTLIYKWDHDHVFTIESVTMNGEPRRHMIGEWAVPDDVPAE